jgi:hypothetical protein
MLLGEKEAARSVVSPSGSWKVTVGQEGFVAVAMRCRAGRLGVVVRLGRGVVVPGAEDAAATSWSIQAARTRSTHRCFNADNVAKAFPARCSELGVASSIPLLSSSPPLSSSLSSSLGGCARETRWACGGCWVRGEGKGAASK